MTALPDDYDGAPVYGYVSDPAATSGPGIPEGVCPGCNGEPSGHGELWCQQCIDEANAENSDYMTASDWHAKWDMRRSREQIAHDHPSIPLPAYRTSYIYACPECAGDLTHEGVDGYWCAACARCWLFTEVGCFDETDYERD